MHNVIVILGPTASGKSSLGVKLAKKFHGIVISADSRQVYRGLDIGTAKITKKEMAGVPHYLLDVASPRGQYSVSHFVRDFTHVMKKIPESTPVFIVGGSPYYIKAITVPGSFSPVPPNEQLRRRLEKKSTAQLIAILNKKNPVWAKTIDRANRRRLIRAIEVSSEKGSKATPDLPPMNVMRIGLKVSRQKLHRRIDDRVDSRMRQGMAQEVARLQKNGLSWKRLNAFGLEYRYLSLFLRGSLTKADAVSQLKSAIHAFVRRQETWWRKEKDIRWITKTNSAAPLVRNFLA